MSRVAVIGANSFTGSGYILHGLAKGWNILGMSRSEEKAPCLLRYKWFSDLNDAAYTFHKIDINENFSGCLALLQQFSPEYIVNFAAQSMVGQSWQQPEDWMNTNVTSTVKLMSQLDKLPQLKRYVHVSTPESYGSCDQFVTEHRNYNPSTPYAVSRAASDMAAHIYHEFKGYPIVITRAANVYGACQQLYRLIPKTLISLKKGIKLPLHGGGLSNRVFIHIEDVATATDLIMHQGQNGSCYHISGDEVISIRDLVAKMCTLVGVEFTEAVSITEDRIGKDQAYLLDSSKLKQELGWQEEISLEQGLMECKTWIEEGFSQLSQLPLEYQHKS